MSSTQDTRKHIKAVRARLDQVVANLKARGKAHDASKLEEPERSGFAALAKDLRAVAYGSDDYRAALQEAKPTIEHHYAANTHHPEHYPNGIRDMSLLDIVEMFADWAAASERTQDGSLAQSLPINAQRFGYGPELAAIFENTRKELDW